MDPYQRSRYALRSSDSHQYLPAAAALQQPGCKDPVVNSARRPHPAQYQQLHTYLTYQHTCTPICCVWHVLQAQVRHLSAAAGLAAGPVIYRRGKSTASGPTCLSIDVPVFVFAASQSCTARGICLQLIDNLTQACALLCRPIGWELHKCLRGCWQRQVSHEQLAGQRCSPLALLHAKHSCSVHGNSCSSMHQGALCSAVLRLRVLHILLVRILTLLSAP
jgi:hypothetical protein